MKDQELVLRFWAFFRFDYLDPQNKKEIASFLDKAMEDIKRGDEQYREDFKNLYSTAIDRCYQLLGKSGFEKYPQSNSRKPSKNSTLFEVWMVELVKLKKSDFAILAGKKIKLREELLSLLKDSEFLNAITYSTQKKIHVKIRYEKVKTLIDMVLND